MGQMSAMASISRVLDKHEKELIARLRKRYRSKLIRRFDLSNRDYSIAVQAELTDGTLLDLEPLDIDSLGEEFPDCEVGY
jgi:hypothetical protein